MDLYGIIGNPLGKSQSKPFFNQKFADEGIDARYEAYELSHIEEVTFLLALHPNLKGFNVTIPYKEQIIPFLKDVSPEAAAIKAVNVVKVEQTPQGAVMHGFNSDVIGFGLSLDPLLTPELKKALILGTGGASKAVAYALAQRGIDYRFVSRTAGPDKYSYQELTPAIIQERQLIINCTPLGMYFDQCPAIPYECLTPRHLLYDVVYHPEVTLFMQRGAAQGARTKNGYEMWYRQALASWDIWNR